MSLNKQDAAQIAALAQLLDRSAVAEAVNPFNCSAAHFGIADCAACGLKAEEQLDFPVVVPERFQPHEHVWALQGCWCGARRCACCSWLGTLMFCNAPAREDLPDGTRCAEHQRLLDDC